MSPSSETTRLGTHRRMNRTALVGVVAMIPLLQTAASPIGALPRLLSSASTDIAGGIASIQRLIDDGRYDEAYYRCRDLLRTSERLTGPESLPTAEILSLLQEAHGLHGQVRDKDEVLGEGLRALAIQERILGQNDPRIASTLVVLGDTITLAYGDLAQGEAFFRRALEIRRRAFGAESSEVAEVLTGMGQLARTQSNYRRAHDLLAEALSIAERNPGDKSAVLARALAAMGWLERQMGDYPASCGHWERALQLREPWLGEIHPEIARTLSGLSISLWFKGDYGAALQAAEKALEIQRRTLEAGHPMIGSSLLNLGGMLCELGDFQAALPMLERACEIGGRALADDHGSAGHGDNNVGEVLFHLGDLAGAKRRLLRALELKERVNGPNHWELISTLALLAAVERTQGNLEGADSLLERSRRIAVATYPPNHPTISVILDDLSELRLLQGRPADARRLASESLAHRGSLLGTDHPLVARSLLLLAMASWREGQVPSAMDLSLQASRLVRRHLRRTARYLSEREALRYEAIRSTTLDLALDTLGSRSRPGADPGDIGRVFEEVIRSRALVLDEMASRHHATLSSEDPATESLRRDLVDARRSLARLIARGPVEGSAAQYRKSFQEARDQEERIERMLAQRSQRHRSEGNPLEPGLPEIRGALPPASVLLSFVLHRRYPSSAAASDETLAASEASYSAFVYDPRARKLGLIRLGKAEAIEERIQAWSRTVLGHREGADGVAEYRKAGEALRKLIWDPVAPALQGARVILVVPDGAINLVNFATLPVGNDSYLIEKSPVIHYLTVERDLLSSEEAGTSGTGLLAVGGPDFDGQEAPRNPTESASPLLASVRRSAQAACGGFRSLTFPALPGTLTEVQDLAELWHRRCATATCREQISILTGKDARETEILTRAPGRRIIHLATHGFFLGGECASDLAAAQGASGDRRLRPGEVIGGENPLLLAGLALAGANRRGEAGPGLPNDDGMLTASEIAGLDLRGVQLAVLSGCETGTGAYVSGEGILGLRRAFQIAGARTLVMSLWPVADQSARQWMLEFYKSYLAGLSAPESAQQASLALLQDQRSAGITALPSSWGAFVTAGAWR